MVKVGIVVAAFLALVVAAGGGVGQDHQTRLGAGPSSQRRTDSSAILENAPDRISGRSGNCRHVCIGVAVASGFPAINAGESASVTIREVAICNAITT